MTFHLCRVWCFGAGLAVLVGCAENSADGDGLGAPTGATSGGGAGVGGSSTAGGAAGAAGAPDGNGGAGGSVGGCDASEDCAAAPEGQVCDTSTGLCVECTPEDDICPDGQYCNDANTCEVGCTDEADCPGPTVCDPDQNLCTDCADDPDCPAGSVCIGNTCIPGCSPTQPCQVGSTCCGTDCVDILSDPNYCGTCTNKCDAPPNAATTCVNGSCGMGACNAGWDDCDGDLINGCEHSVLEDGACTCTPGSTQPCYYGAPGTLNVGPCQAGAQTCNPSGASWGACLGQVLPSYELCANGVDEDCNGQADVAFDADGDGFSYCQADCDPSNTLVNPGAFEVVANGVDDDCDPLTPDAGSPACASAAKFTAVTPQDVATAIELCQTAPANPTNPALKKWGVLSAEFRHANGAASVGTNHTNFQAAVLQNYGTGGIVPHAGATMAGISTGRMRDANDAGFVVPVTGTGFGHTISFATPGTPLGTYLAQHGGGLEPGQCGAMACPIGSGANDSINVRLVVRVPTNAQSFSYDFRFFSGEYFTFQCTQFNDYYLAMLQSLDPGIPADHNISFDAFGKPVSVNNGFFENCGGNGKNCGTCPSGTAALAGTGMDQVSGGGTDWLTTDAPIEPGETVTLELVIFDVGDTIYDSLVVLDNFRWNLLPAVVGTHE